MQDFPVVHGVTVAVAPPDDYDVDFEHPKRRHEIESYVVSGLGMAIAALFFFQFMYVKLGLLRKADGETGMCPFGCFPGYVLSADSMPYSRVVILYRGSSRGSS